jgi:hypothetical protein
MRQVANAIFCNQDSDGANVVAFGAEWHVVLPIHIHS